MLRAIHLNPSDPDYFISRFSIWNEPADAIADLEQYLKLGGGARNGNTERVETMIRELREKLKG